MAKYGMAIDLDKCVGCGACALACKSENNTEYDSMFNRYDNINGRFNWADFYTMTEGAFAHGNVKFTVIPVLCNHCTDAPCVEICPVEPKAMYKSENGITLHNDERCIGCKRCQTACPYSARGVLEYAGVQYSVISYNDYGLDTHPFYKNEKQIISGCTASPKELVEQAGEIPPMKNDYSHPDYFAVRPSDVTEKCIFCDHRVQHGDNPYCVDSCPSGARVFGDLDDAQSLINQELTKGYKRLKNNQGEFLGVGEAGTQPNVFYLGGFNIPTRTKYVEKPEIPMMVYPNPANYQAHVKFTLEKSSEITLALFDFQGRKVTEIVNREFRMSGEHVFGFNVSGLKPGTFIVRLVTEETTQSANLIVFK